MISHDEVVKILRMHGIEPDSETAWIPETQEHDPESTFYKEFGIKSEYSQKELFIWLGY